MNKRIFYAIQQVQIAPNGTAADAYTSAYAVHGLQSLGMDTRFNLDSVFEIGQLNIYENIEEIPEVEVTLEKVFDGYPLLYHLCTPDAASPTLIGRSNDSCQILLTFYDDTRDSASGTPMAEVECSGMFLSNWTSNLVVDGSFTESVTLIGNSKIWRASPSGSGAFPSNNDAPIGDGGVQRREDILFGSGASGSVLPPIIRGITDVGGGTGYNMEISGAFGASLQSIRTTAGLGRDELRELGRRKPYHRFATFPVEVRNEFECYTKDGDYVDALPESTNLEDQTIILRLREGTVINCGNRNKLDSVSQGGGAASAQGDNATTTYSFLGYNVCTVTHPEDPAGF